MKFVSRSMTESADCSPCARKKTESESINELQTIQPRITRIFADISDLPMQAGSDRINCICRWESLRSNLDGNDCKQRAESAHREHSQRIPRVDSTPARRC